MRYRIEVTREVVYRSVYEVEAADEDEACDVAVERDRQGDMDAGEWFDVKRFPADVSHLTNSRKAKR